MNRDMKWSVALFMIGIFMAALDNGIITSSLTTLIESFGVSPTWGAWTITLYTLGLAISVPIAGKLSDRYGRRNLFLIEVGLFGIGSLLVALSSNFIFFLVARFIQALGGGGIFIIASSYVLHTFPKEKQGRMLGMFGGMNGIAAILGPNIGSLILSATGSWHWLFLINVPIAIFLIGFGLLYVKERQQLVEAKLDWSGIALLIASVLLLMYSFTQLEGVNVLKSILSPSFYVVFTLGLVFLVLFYLFEKRVAKNGEDPVVRITMLHNPAFRYTLLLSFFSGAILSSVIFIPGYVEQSLNVSSSVAGYWFTPLALASGIGAGSGGILVDKRGPVQALLLASVLSFIGFLLFPLWVDSLWQMVIASMFVGVGFGIMLGAPINVLVSEQAGADKGIGLATSSLARQMAMSIAPTIYAGFIARSFMSIGDKIQAGFTEIGLNGNADPSMLGMLGMNGEAQESISIEQLRSAIDGIPLEPVKRVLNQAIHLVVNNGYNGLFWSGAVISVLAFITALILSRARKRQISTAEPMERLQHQTVKS